MYTYKDLLTTEEYKIKFKELIKKKPFLLLVEDANGQTPIDAAKEVNDKGFIDWLSLEVESHSNLISTWNIGSIRWNATMLTGLSAVIVYSIVFLMLFTNWGDHSKSLEDNMGSVVAGGVPVQIGTYLIAFKALVALRNYKVSDAIEKVLNIADVTEIQTDDVTVSLEKPKVVSYGSFYGATNTQDLLADQDPSDREISSLKPKLVNKGSCIIL